VFFLVLRGQKIRAKQLVLVVVYPLIYLALAYVLRVTTGAYVYPFFDPAQMRGSFGVVLALLVLAVLFIGLAVLYRLAWNKKMDSRKEDSLI
jgi:membrane protein YdbS with pleckstrin-like domain